jgi:copper(I)-binding protein
MARSRRLALIAVAAVIPLLAGCEAGNNAPTLQFHYPTDTGGYPADAVGTAGGGSLAIRNVFVLGAPLGKNLAKGQSAGLFLALVNSGAPDRLTAISTSAASSVTLPAGGIKVTDGPPVLLTGPKPVLVLTDLTRPLLGGSDITLKLTFARAGVITLIVPVMPKAAHYVTYAPPPPSPAASVATTAAKHHKAHVSPSPSASAG